MLMTYQVRCVECRAVLSFEEIDLVEGGAKLVFGIKPCADCLRKAGENGTGAGGWSTPLDEEILDA